MFANACLSVLISASLALASADVTSNAEVLQRDVVVVGGGASGSYAAVRLQQMGKSVALIEKESRLGGKFNAYTKCHVNTYTDPPTGKTFDYGVQIFSNISVLRDFFNHFEIPLVSPSGSGGQQQIVDFRTVSIAPINIYTADGIGEALFAYEAQLAKYPGIVERWDIPSPVPEDLLLNFGEFLKKYNLTVMAPLTYVYNQGLGNTLAQPTMYVMKYFDQQIVGDILNSGFIANGLANNQLLYDRAQAELGSNLFLSSQVKQVKRSNQGVKVQFITPTGSKIVQASKLLLSIPPKLSSLGFLDLTINERQIFSQFNNSYYWDAIVRNTGIPTNVSLTNIDPGAPMNIPASPVMYDITATGIDNTHAVHYSSPYYLTLDQVKSDIVQTLSRLQAGLNYTASGAAEIVEIHDHSPFELTVGKQAIEGGFYGKLQTLQGEKNTWWTGAAWNKHATAQLWNFTEFEVLPGLLKGL